MADDAYAPLADIAPCPVCAVCGFGGRAGRGDGGGGGGGYACHGRVPVIFVFLLAGAAFGGIAVEGVVAQFGFFDGYALVVPYSVAVFEELCHVDVRVACEWFAVEYAEVPNPVHAVCLHRISLVCEQVPSSVRLFEIVGTHLDAGGGVVPPIVDVVECHVSRALYCVDQRCEPLAVRGAVVLGEHVCRQVAVAAYRVQQVEVYQ